jgi:hypothetical protein
VCVHVPTLAYGTRRREDSRNLLTPRGQEQLAALRRRWEYLLRMEGGDEQRAFVAFTLYVVFAREAAAGTFPGNQSTLTNVSALRAVLCPPPLHSLTHPPTHPPLDDVWRRPPTR